MNSTEEPGWFKSSYSSGEGGACVEVAAQPRTIRIRDSKNPETAQLTVTLAGWTAFVAYVREGDQV